MSFEEQKIKETLRANYQNLPQKRLDGLAKEVVFAPEKRKIDLNGQKISASDLRYQIAGALENKSSAGPDLEMMLASSVERLNSETSSEQEYFRWLDECSEIMKDMNDGFITEDDLKERNGFLEMSHQRESELMLCLGLYAGSSNPKAAEKAALLRYKLQRLREMRQSIEAHTRNEADTKVSKEEYETALPYYKAFKKLARAGFGAALTLEEARLLESYGELPPQSEFYDLLRNNVLDDALKEEENALQNALPEHAQEISDKLKDLTGRRKTFQVRYMLLENAKARLQNN